VVLGLRRTTVTAGIVAWILRHDRAVLVVEEVGEADKSRY
jgi:hypothetical protein